MFAKVFVDSEYGVLKEVLLCPPCTTPPRLFSVKEQMKGSLTKAASQHKMLVKLLEKEGVTCHLLSPCIEMPFQCFMRDSAVATPWGMLLAKMNFRPRHKEPEILENFLKGSDVIAWNIITKGTLESGDVMLIRPGYVAIGYNNNRTTEDAAQIVKQWFESHGWCARIIKYPRAFVHLDVVLGVVDQENIIYCEGVISAADCAWLSHLQFNLHPVPSSESIKMICNILSLGDKKIFSSYHSTYGNALLTSLGFQIFTIDISEFISNDGGIHCLVLPLKRE